MHVVVALQVIPHAVLVHGCNERILIEPALGRVAAKQGVNVVLADQAFVPEHEGVTVRRLASQLY